MTMRHRAENPQAIIVDLFSGVYDLDDVPLEITDALMGSEPWARLFDWSLAFEMEELWLEAGDEPHAKYEHESFYHVAAQWFEWAAVTLPPREKAILRAQADALRHVEYRPPGHEGRRSAIRIGNFTDEQWEAIKRAYGYRCAYCGTKSGVLHKDHFIPIVDGGQHEASNIVPSCPPCNYRKNANPAPSDAPLRLMF